jgi:recombination protein RecT
MSQETATRPNQAKGTAIERGDLGALRTKLENAKDKLMQVAPSYLNVERMTRLLLAACSGNPKILECTAESVMLFAMKCAETGLELIGPGGAWPIPFKTKDHGMILQFIPDYRGMANLAKRAGCIVDYDAHVVREKDQFDYELGLTPDLRHKPGRGDRGPIEAVYCVCILPGGLKKFTVMDRLEVLAIKRRSRAANNGPWVTDEGEMFKKTVIRRAMKGYVGMSAMLDAAVDAFDAAEMTVVEGTDSTTSTPPSGKTQLGQQQNNGSHGGSGGANGGAAAPSAPPSETRATPGAGERAAGGAEALLPESRASGADEPAATATTAQAPEELFDPAQAQRLAAGEMTEEDIRKDEAISETRRQLRELRYSKDVEAIRRSVETRADWFGPIAETLREECEQRRRQLAEAEKAVIAQQHAKNKAKRPTAADIQ